MVSGRQDGKNVCFPTQRYDVQSDQFGIRFVSILSEELEGMQGWKWNTERVTVFQTGILQLFCLVTGAKNIRV